MPKGSTIKIKDFITIGANHKFIDVDGDKYKLGDDKYGDHRYLRLYFRFGAYDQKDYNRIIEPQRAKIETKPF